VDLLLGRTVDRRLDAWESAFLPRELRAAARKIKLPDGSILVDEPRVLFKRERPSPFAGRDPHIGVKLYWGLAALATVMALVLVLLARRRSRWAGVPLFLLALVVGVPGLAVWSVAAAATLPELYLNELVLSLWPLDLGLLWPAGRWLRGRLWAGRLLRGYALVRLVVIGLVLLGHLAGLLVQQPRCWLATALVLALSLFFAVRDLERAGGSETSKEVDHGNEAPDPPGSLPSV
jgi:hypothetical protein